jgi:hypothetical protein
MSVSKFEYEVDRILTATYCDDKKLSVALNRLGKKGWQIVNFEVGGVYCKLVLMREKKSKGDA